MHPATSTPTPEPVLTPSPLAPLHLEGLAPGWLDDCVAVIDKPAGLPAVPGRAEHLRDCAASRLQAVMPDAQVVHRLDMATSGLMLLARGAHWQRVFSRLFAERQMHKRYVAVVSGLMANDSGEIALPLIADWPNRPLQKVDVVTGKPSLTRYRVIGRDASRHTTRVELEPVTGRSHQLRVHLQAIGHPIVGDTLYAPAGIAAASPRLLLHALRLSFTHPAHGGVVCIGSELPF